MSLQHHMKIVYKKLKHWKNSWKRELFNEDNWQEYYAILVQGFTIERGNIQSQFQMELN